MLPNGSFAIKFGFSQVALLDMIGRMEDKIAAYIQNISISLVNMPITKKKAKKIDKNKTKDEKSNEEDDTTRHLQAPDKN